jgi:hypothetical protein
MPPLSRYAVDFRQPVMPDQDDRKIFTSYFTPFFVRIVDKTTPAVGCQEERKGWGGPTRAKIKNRQHSLSYMVATQSNQRTAIE